MKQRPTIPLLFAALLLAPCALECQSPPLSRPQASGPVAAKINLSAEEIFARFASRIFFLTCDESADASSLASGVLVSADGFIVTNAHVVSDCRSMRATHINGAARRSYEPVLKYYDEKSDIAVLKIDGQSSDFFDVSPRPVRTGERIYAIGNPRGFEQSISEGIVSGNREEDGVSWIQHSAPISPGSSGGALISSRGELLGINSFLLRESQNLNFAVPASTLAQAISSARKQPRSLDFPLLTRVTGTYTGVVTNLGSAESAGFSIFVRGSDSGAIQGCMVVKLPLFGSGALQGTADSSKLSFVTTGDFMKIRFEGERAGGDIAGAYLVSDLPDGASDQKGTFILHKISSEVPSHDLEPSCAGDVALLRSAADEGNADAELALGLLYYEGHGVPKDSSQGDAWIRKAAKQGNASAQRNLGAAYQMGSSAPQDYGQAAAWYLKAAEQGDAVAEYLLGVLYISGNGVPQNFRDGYFWIKIASAGTVEGKKPEELKAELDAVAARLSPSELAQTNERVQTWLSARPSKHQ